MCTEFQLECAARLLRLGKKRGANNILRINSKFMVRAILPNEIVTCYKKCRCPEDDTVNRILSCTYL